MSNDSRIPMIVILGLVALLTSGCSQDQTKQALVQADLACGVYPEGSPPDLKETIEEQLEATNRYEAAYAQSAVYAAKAAKLDPRWIELYTVADQIREKYNAHRYDLNNGIQSDPYPASTERGKFNQICRLVNA
ncbi:MAG: hypothetical protein WCL12_06695 [Actinomycetes bacterium]